QGEGGQRLVAAAQRQFPQRLPDEVARLAGGEGHQLRYRPVTDFLRDRRYRHRFRRGGQPFPQRRQRGPEFEVESLQRPAGAAAAARPNRIMPRWAAMRTSASGSRSPPESASSTDSPTASSLPSAGTVTTSRSAVTAAARTCGSASFFAAARAGSASWAFGPI